MAEKLAAFLEPVERRGGLKAQVAKVKVSAAEEGRAEPEKIEVEEAYVCKELSNDGGSRVV